MSAEATAYVTPLERCPDGANVTCAHKAVLWCLADHHNRSTRQCNPSQERLMAESRLSKDTVQRALSYLEEHGILKVVRPYSQGRGKYCSYTFLELDTEQASHQTPPDTSKGEHSDPLFSLPKRGAEGEHTAAKRGAEGEHTPVCNMEEPRTRRNQEPKPSTPPDGGELLKLWLRVKSQMQKSLPADEWKLWVRPAYLLHVMSGNVALIALPPNGRICEAARSGLPRLREVAAQHGFRGVNLTAYPDRYTRERLAERFPQFYWQMYGGKPDYETR